MLFNSKATLLHNVRLILLIVSKPAEANRTKAKYSTKGTLCAILPYKSLAHQRYQYCWPQRYTRKCK